MQTPSQKLATIVSTITGYNLPPGIENALTAKLSEALADINRGDTATAINVLQAFVNQCKAQSGKKLTTSQANELILLATETIASLQ